MPISVTCGCGKALRVKDEWAGKNVTCPSCGGTFMVTSTGGRVGANAAAEVWAGSRRSRGETGKGGLSERFSISPMYIVIIAFMLLVPAVVLFAKMGPLKAQKQWAALESQADSDVSTICGRALQAHLQKEGLYDPSNAHFTPGVQAVTFEPSPLMVRLPDTITFTGRCTGGFFHGTYNPKTREIIKAEVPGEGTRLNVTGRIKGNDVQVEIDGETVNVDYSKKKDADDAVLPPQAMPRFKRKK